MKIFKQFESIRTASAKKNIPDHPNTKAVFSHVAIIRRGTVGNVEVRLLAPNAAHLSPPPAALFHYLIHKAHSANNMQARPSRLEDLSN